ncbi:LOW QUALITY PROTEIN: uncharacterized protein [Amphiura filiformis]|uniref:LOW QUALITY PROTEIN: uncharacterized protein n=1 Tax=Amphiura filiformis TaxID=82378 RepID=UPI003B20F231
MERRQRHKTSPTITPTIEPSSPVLMSDEETQMIFCILKELDLFLENEEAILKKELLTFDDRDAVFKSKDVLTTETKKLVELTGIDGREDIVKEDGTTSDTCSDVEQNRTDDSLNSKGTFKESENAELDKQKSENNNLDSSKMTKEIIVPTEDAKPEEQIYRGETTKDENGKAIKDGDEDEDDDDTDTGSSTSFGMPIADACVECFHTEINSALSNAVRTSHVACLQAILEQLFQSREAAEKKKQRHFKRISRRHGKNGHVFDCNQHEEDVAWSEPNLAASPLLLQAVTRGNSQVVHLVLKCLEDLQQLQDSLLISDSTGKRPIHLAAYLNHTGCLDLLLQKTPVKRVYWRDKHGRTPFLVAAAGGAVQCLKRLMEVDDVGATGNDGANAVCLAAEAGSVGCLEVLIDQAMLDPTVADDAGMTPLHLAAEAGHLNCTHWLVRRASCSLNVQRKRDGATPMHLAAAKGRCPIIQWALNRELSCVDELDYFGRTPVHYAAEEGHITALKTFAKFLKVDLCAKDFLGRTPSQLADRRGHLGCVRYLDSSSKHKRSDRDAYGVHRPGKISRSLSSSNVNKLVRRGSGRRSAKRREISSVYLEGLPGGGAQNGTTEHLSVDAYLSGRKTGSIIPKMVTQVGLMSLATVVPDANFLKGMIRSESVTEMVRSKSDDVKAGYDETFQS